MRIGRRGAIVGGATALATAGGTATLAMATTAKVPLTSLEALNGALDRIERAATADPKGVGALRAERGGWTLQRTLEHCAQSIRYSMIGYPEMKPKLFINTVGVLALALFNGRGAMTHALDAPIPGAPDLPDGADALAGVAAMRRALVDWSAFTGTPAPHFAYGPVDRDTYGRVQAMHVANHLEAFPTLLPLLTA